MTPEHVQLRREDLYEQVWAEPTLRLAQRYGISGVALAKICRKMGIPVPPRGYWARKKFGNAPPRPPLPAPEEGVRTVVTIPNRMVHRHDPSPETAALIAPTEPPEQITVPDQLTRPHPLIALTRDAFRQRTPDTRGVLHPDWSQRPLDIHVGKNSVPRALRIVDTLIKALEAKGFRVQVGAEDKHPTYAEILGEEVEFALEETFQRTPHVLSAKEKADQDKWGRRSFPEWDYLPTGLLKLRLDEYAEGARKLWSDGKTQRLEEMLLDVLKGMVLVAEAKRAYRLERERLERERREAEARRLELERRRRLEEARRRATDQQVANWVKSRNLRTLLEALERAALERGLPMEPGSDLHQWLTWARAYAAQLDPLQGDLPPKCPPPEPPPNPWAVPWER